MKLYTGPREVIFKISEKTGYKNEVIKNVFDKFAEVAHDELEKGLSVSIPGTGILYYKLISRCIKNETGKFVPFKIPKLKVRDTSCAYKAKQKHKSVNQETVEILLKKQELKKQQKEERKIQNAKNPIPEQFK